MVKWIICSGPDWYRPSVTSTKQIIEQFYKNGYKILWINPIPFKGASVNSVSKKSFNQKLKNKFITHLKLFKKNKKWFYVYVPFYLPFFANSIQKLNSSLVKFQLKLLMILLGIHKDQSILWISGNFTLLSETKEKYFKKIYQAADLISDFRTENLVLKNSLYIKEKILCENSDIIFAASENIHKKTSEMSGKKVDLLLHGVEFDHFNKTHTISEKMKKIMENGLPIAGYFGSLSDANYKDVYLKLAESDFSVVLIGKVLGDYTGLERHRNIHFIGPIDYRILPSYAKAFDICLLTWYPAAWIDNSFPIKSLEYLSMGKPILSVPIAILQKLFRDIIYFAETPDDFVKQAKLALKENNNELIKKRIDAVRNLDWSNRYEYIKKQIFDEQTTNN